MIEILVWLKSQSSVGFVPSETSSPFVTPSPSQSFANQLASGVSVTLVINKSQASYGLVPSVISVPFNTPSPSQSKVTSVGSQQTPPGLLIVDSSQ